MTTYTVQITQISNVLHNSKHETTSYILCYFPTKLTPKRTVLEELIFRQLVKKFLAFYGTQTFITVFTGARHWNLH
jgi:hypothetical protein